MVQYIGTKAEWMVEKAKQLMVTYSTGYIPKAKTMIDHFKINHRSTRLHETMNSLNSKTTTYRQMFYNFICSGGVVYVNEKTLEPEIVSGLYIQWGVRVGL